jgi:hypothetical protein
MQQQNVNKKTKYFPFYDDKVLFVINMIIVFV